MSDTAEWHEHNESYLSAALKWLRLLLLRHSPPESAPISAAAAEAALPPEAGGLFRRRVAPAQSAAPAAAVALLPAPPPVTDADVAQAAEKMRAAESAVPAPALIVIARQLDLTRFEQEVLLLCAAVELDTRIAALCARAQDDPRRTYPTFALAMAILENPEWSALSAQRPLRHLQLVEITQPAGTPLTVSALRADERIVNAIKGLNELDDRLAALVVPARSAASPLPPSQHATADALLRALVQAADDGWPTAAVLSGPDTPSKELIAAAVAAALNRYLYRLPATHLPSQIAELETLARLWQRESQLLPLALYVDAHDVEASPADGGRAAALDRFMARGAGIRFLGVREVWRGADELAGAFEIANPTPAEQQELWAEAPELAGTETPALLAGNFNLDSATIERATRAALAEGDAAGPLQDRLWRACIASTRPRLDALAQRLDVRATWNQIVLPDEPLGLLRRIADQVRQRSRVYDEWGFRARMNRGLGVSALFTGDSGTGKTMAAEVIANELQLDLYRIDLSAVVSKYIGETEKNLRRLFDAAEDGGAILFFDEADALFGKRSEVKDSHDRYANIEINYLLQRMEAYRGLAILATNMRSALDPAFVRRLRFIVDFAFPGAAERAEIWRKMFPPEAPLAELDYERLGQFNLSGGSIQNIALNAAFMAAAKQPPRVTMPLVLEAARAEFRKMERPINERDFAWDETA
jgi:hypothetical protein